MFIITNLLQILNNIIDSHYDLCYDGRAAKFTYKVNQFGTALTTI